MTTFFRFGRIFLREGWSGENAIATNIHAGLVTFSRNFTNRRKQVQVLSRAPTAKFSQHVEHIEDFEGRLGQAHHFAFDGHQNRAAGRSRKTLGHFNRQRLALTINFGGHGLASGQFLLPTRREALAARRFLGQARRQGFSLVSLLAGIVVIGVDGHVFPDHLPLVGADGDIDPRLLDLLWFGSRRLNCTLPCMDRHSGRRSRWRRCSNYYHLRLGSWRRRFDDYHLGLGGWRGRFDDHHLRLRGGRRWLDDHHPWFRCWGRWSDNHHLRLRRWRRLFDNDHLRLAWRRRWRVVTCVPLMNHTTSGKCQGSGQ